jgi:hypothetical protein
MKRAIIDEAKATMKPESVCRLVACGFDETLHGAISLLIIWLGPGGLRSGSVISPARKRSTSKPMSSRRRSPLNKMPVSVPIARAGQIDDPGIPKFTYGSILESSTAMKCEQDCASAQVNIKSKYEKHHELPCSS